MRSSPALIYMYSWVERSTCLASRIYPKRNHFRGQSSSRPPFGHHRLDADRSPNMQSAFLPELHRWISKLTARHLHACPPGDLLITMVKETVILYKKEFRKMKKSRISPWCERDENAKWLRDCLWLCQACERGFTCRPMWRNLRQEAHSYPHYSTCRSTQVKSASTDLSPQEMFSFSEMLALFRVGKQFRCLRLS